MGKQANALKPDRAKVPMYLGPYEYWNFGPGIDYAFPGMRKFTTYITALAEYPPTRPPTIGPAPQNPVKADDLESFLPTLWWMPGLTFLPFVVKKPKDRAEYRGPRGLQKLLQDGLEILSSPPPIVDVSEPRFRVAFPVPDGAMNPKGSLSDPSWAPDAGLRGRIGEDKRITILAVIDDGIPFAHRNFRDADGKLSRVEFCWLQSVAPEKAQGKTQDRPSVLFGREYTRTQIEQHIKDYGNDEDTLYRKAGATADCEELGSLIERHATHGAHVMDLAAGYAAERRAAPAEEIRVIAVQLPNTIALDTSGFGKDMYMLSAFHYIFHRADMIAKGYGIDKCRLVVNFSYGFSGGRHDGGTELEAAIHQLVAKRRETTGPTALVVPAGNMFLDRLHGMVRDEDFVDRKAKFHWRLQANDRTPSYLELWFWQGFNPIGYQVDLFDPSGRRRGWLRVGSDPDKGKKRHKGDPRRICFLYNEAKELVGQISSDHHRSGRWRVLIITAPSEPEKASLPRIEPGKWTVVIRRGRERLVDRPIHCWIQRNSDPETLRSGSRQSYFDDVKDKRYTDEGALSELDTDGAFLQRFGSLNGLATGCTSLIVAGFRLYGGLGASFCQARPAPYSSAGALNAGWPQAQVACSSMSDRSKVLSGTVAAGVRSGSRSFVQGTSASAPFVARQLAAAFVTADDHVVEKAAEDNYRPLLSGYCDTTPGPDQTKARLGEVRVAPHWQPGL